jgi:hypothetical protein
MSGSGSCGTDRIQAGTARTSTLIVALDPDTLWRPRGAEVRFTIQSMDGNQAPKVEVVTACFRWSGGPQEAAMNAPRTEGTVQQTEKEQQTSSMTDHRWYPSPLVRSVPNTSGRVEYGAIVPDLPQIGVGWTERLRGTQDLDFTGVFTVPVAYLQVTVQQPGQNGSQSTSTTFRLPVGITSVWASVLTVVISVAIAAWALLALAPKWSMPGNEQKEVNPILRVISTTQGVASLSQAQIIVWTFVVGAAAVYVMGLSGNLISISGGILTLLGIAGTVSVLDRVTKSSGAAADVQATRTETSASADSTMGDPTNPQNFGGSKPALAADRTADGARRRPNWGQLLKSGAATDEMEVDVTHVQMLVFTLVTATFVAVKVAVSYEIPEIPDNFLLLMGISNGVYIAGRQVTPAVKNGGAE